MTMRHRMAAYRDLLKLYRAALAHAWQRRHTRAARLFSEQEAEFLPGALSLQERPVSSTAMVTARVLCLLIAVLIIWSILGHIDIVVSAQGKIIPSGHIKTIASVDTASVRALHVVEGQQVKSGDVLVELDTSASDGERDKAIDSRSEAVLQELRARALIAALTSNERPRWPSLRALQHEDSRITAVQSRAEELHLEGVYRDYLAKLTRIDGDIARYTQALPLVTQTAQDYGALLKSHDISEHAWLEKEHARVDLEGQLADAKNQRAALRAETRRDAYDQLTEGTKSRAAADQDAIRFESHSKLLRLIAPVDGVVQQLTVHTIGGVVAAAQPLMEIVPNEKTVEVEATVDNKDIGFVQEGQAAQVKVGAFEYTKYGTVQATVAHVSRDAVQDEKKGLQYLSRITLSRATINVDGRTLALTPGMAVNVDIRTGDRRIIEYFLAPLLQHQRESLHER
ncbi:HlyD family type I secretion periplasmic adaptor subunit [Janthinobacterium sp. RB2R34]|uniref:HlyD family type I secretion periplasmic adaptor subunit n=1 Tax=Janthinobacterium sp. RB2R34 TaxID=3424193 RepID=UPI003F24B91D